MNFSFSKSCIAILFLLVSFAAITQKSTMAEDKILGTYWSPKKDAKILIYKESNHFYGKFIWGNQPRKDTKNPNITLRNRDLVGTRFLTNFHYANSVYKCGEIYDPNNGKTYDSTITLTEKVSK